jgi:hypothetical protein
VQGLLDLVGGGFTLGTEQATTSGTSVTFSGIPAGIKMLIFMFEGVSLTSDVSMDLTLGDSGGLETTGYVSTGWNAGTYVGSTVAFETTSGAAGAGATSGHVIFCLKDSANFTWIASGACKQATANAWSVGGEKSLSAELTQISLSGGTFDGAGSVNIMYQ